MTPEDWSRLFAERLNARDLEGTLSLTNPEARFVSPEGGSVVGVEEDRRVLPVLGKAQMHGRVMDVVTAGDIAGLYTDWDAHQAIEVLRRQHDGRWYLIVDNPHARE